MTIKDIKREEKGQKKIYLGFSDAMSKYSWLKTMAIPRLAWPVYMSIIMKLN